MPRRPDDATVQLRMSVEERAVLNAAFGRGGVNTAIVSLALEAARERLARMPLPEQLSLGSKEVSAA